MIEIIPAIDVIDGKCVRLAQGDFSRKIVYDENPSEVAAKFEAAGLKRLHLVDLDGAKNGRVTNLKILENIARTTNLSIDFSGGIKTENDLQTVFDAGAKMAGIGSVAVKNPSEFVKWLDRFGGEKILLGADVRGEKLAVDGWRTETETEIIPFLQGYFSKGVTQSFVTDISKDGLLNGSANDLYAKIIEAVPELKLIASGGVSKIGDIDELEKIGCAGVIVGKAIYENRIKFSNLTKYAG